VLKFLTIYLIVTGIAAATALAMPSLVVLGFFLLVIPGLLLSLAPTAFLWGCVFTASWLAARVFLGDTLFTALAAGAMTLFALTAVTQPNRTVGDAAFRASLMPDIVPTGPIEMKGDVRLDLPRPRWDNINSRGEGGVRGFACDNLCMALLFTPGVTSVTINNSSRLRAEDHRNGTGGFDAEARTYRLVPKSQCPDGGLLADLVGMNGLFPGKLEEGKALVAEWNLKLADEVCLTRSGPISRHDILIRQGAYGGRLRQSSWGLLPRGPYVEYIEIRDGAGQPLLRRFKSSVMILSRLLFIASTGGIENFRFGWGTTTISNKPEYGSIDLLRELENRTDTVGKMSGKDLLPAMREQLRSALDNPALSSDAPAFGLIPAYFDALANPLPPGDLTIVVGLAADQRISRYEGIWKFDKLPGDQQDAIRAAFVKRAIAADNPAVLLKATANNFIERMPSGSFTSLTPDEEQLLLDPGKRWGLPSLATRLDESGAKRVPLILSIIREHSLSLRRNIDETRSRRNGRYEKSQENDGHRQMVQAGRIALCRLGPDAAIALQPLEEMLGSGVIDARQQTGHDGAKWNLTLVRLGKPISQLKKPAQMSGTDAMHQRNIQQKLERFDPRRSC